MTKIYYTIFNLVALCAISYVGVDIFYSIVRTQLTQVDAGRIVTRQKPEAKKQERLSGDSLAAIINRNIFNTREQQAPSKEVQKEDIESLEPTSLKVALLGTVMAIGENSWAVIEEMGNRSQGLYRVGDSVQDAIIKKILRGKVILRVGDKDEILQIEEANTGEEVRGPRLPTLPDAGARTIFVRRSDVDKSLQDINGLMSSARIIPHSKDGVPDGLVITSVRADSIFRRMGLRNGDIVQGVNGRAIANADDLTSLVNSMRAGSPISVQISRRGRPTTLNYQFRD